MVSRPRPPKWSRLSRCTPSSPAQRASSSDSSHRWACPGLTRPCSVRYLVSSICYLHARVAYPRSIPVADAINVTNTGKVDADDVVLGFLEPPGAGTGGVALQTLFDFQRVNVKAGETVTVNLYHTQCLLLLSPFRQSCLWGRYPSLTDFTHVTVEGERVALPGQFTARFGLRETRELGQGFATHTFTMKTDDHGRTEAEQVFLFGDPEVVPEAEREASWAVHIPPPAKEPSNPLLREGRHWDTHWENTYPTTRFDAVTKQWKMYELFERRSLMCAVPVSLTSEALSLRIGGTTPSCHGCRATRTKAPRYDDYASLICAHAGR